ncbi:MAG: alanine racemase [Desulfobacteraceae bacterium]
MNSDLLWAEVDLRAIAHNTRQLRRIVSPKTRLMVAVKANGYGHGAVAVAKTALAHGADALGVARLEEGVELRNEGIDAPILIFGYTLPALARRLIQYDLTQTVYDIETAKQLSEAIGIQNKPLKIHIKVDTGMGRLGMLSPADSSQWPGETYIGDPLDMVKTIAALPGLELEGIFTHFASSDSRDKTYAESQFKRFSKLLDQLEAAGIMIPLKHAANSGAIIDMPHTHLDMVRAGISLYGLYPSNEVEKTRISLIPAMALKTGIIHLKTVPSGFNVSYNSTWQTSAVTTIATVPVGYGDGYSRAFSNKGQMLVHGHRAPVVGRVCMDLTLLDVGHIPKVKVGDEVVVFGRQKEQCLSADELAAWVNTINYEIVTALTSRVPMIYLSI